MTPWVPLLLEESGRPRLTQRAQRIRRGRRGVRKNQCFAPVLSFALILFLLASAVRFPRTPRVSSASPASSRGLAMTPWVPLLLEESGRPPLNAESAEDTQRPRGSSEEPMFRSSSFLCFDSVPFGFRRRAVSASIRPEAPHSDPTEPHGGLVSNTPPPRSRRTAPQSTRR